MKNETKRYLLGVLTGLILMLIFTAISIYLVLLDII